MSITQCSSFHSFRSFGCVVPVMLGALVALASATVPADEAAFEWQKRKVALNFESPRVGKHTLNELRVGETWRLGANAITTMTFDTALVAGDGVVAPGTYRVNLARPGQKDFALTIEGAGSWTLAALPDVSAPGTYSEAKKPNDKLEIFCSADKTQPDAEMRALNYEIQFGSPVITVPVTIVGTTSQAAKGFTLDAFKFPSELLKNRLEAGMTTPVLSLARKQKPRDGEPARLNLLLGEKEAILIPAATPPTENRGFGAVPKPDGKWILRGTVAWTTTQKPADHFRVDTVEFDKEGALHVIACCGDRQADLRVPMEPAKQ